MPDPPTPDTDGRGGPAGPGERGGFGPPPIGRAAPVLALVRFRLSAPTDEDGASGGQPAAAAAGAEFAAAAERALAAFTRSVGFRSGRLARAVDDPDAWVLATEWDGPGAWRRALGGFDVRCELTPLLVHAIDAPGAFEVLVGQDGPTAPPSRHGSALAPDAATAGPGR
jgi:hypothetical protein